MLTMKLMKPESEKEGVVTVNAGAVRAAAAEKNEAHCHGP